MVYVAFWGALLAGIGLLVAVEAFARSRAVHGPMAATMLATALRLILPFAAAQVLIAVAICRFAPQNAWLVPGLWQVVVALVGFSAVPHLPRAIVWVAVWFFVCAAVVLVAAGSQQALSPCMMGVPFTIGHGMNEHVAALMAQIAHAMDPEYNTPLAVFLASEACTSTHALYSQCLGRVARVFVGVVPGWQAGRETPPSVEEIAAHWNEICDTSRGFATPLSPRDELALVLAQGASRA